MTDRKRPTFIGIGGHKYASTWLSECMRDHPEIFITEPKEVAYFSHRFGKGTDWYLQHFEGASRYSQAGEFTSHYLYDPAVPQRMLDVLGPVPVLAVVREPAARSLSQIKYGIRHGFLPKPGQSVLSLAALQTAIAKYPEIVDRSLYAQGIARFVTTMGRENVLILNQADFAADPAAVLAAVWRFLGVDTSFLPSRAQKMVSVGITPRFQLLENLRTGIFYFLNKRWPGLITLGRRMRIGEAYRRLNAGPGIRLSEEAIIYLCDLFREDWSQTQAYCCRPGGPLGLDSRQASGLVEPPGIG